MSQDLTREIEALEDALLSPAVRGSRDRLSALLADDFLEFGESGTAYTKDEILAHLPQTRPATYTVRDFAVEALSRDVALATYRIEARGPAGNVRHSVRSSIWLRCDGVWRLRFHQGTTTSASPS
jgi:hypothetical protein